MYAHTHIHSFELLAFVPSLRSFLQERGQRQGEKKRKEKKEREREKKTRNVTKPNAAQQKQSRARIAFLGKSISLSV